VTDVGTIFTVEIRKDGRTDVVVAEGVVAADALQAAHSPDVKSPCRDASEAPNLALTASTPLLHHEWARTQRIGSNVGLKKGTLTNAQLDRRMSWPSGELKFAGEPLAEVVSEVNRYFQTQVTLDDSIEDLSIKGVYTTDSLDKFIHSITYMQPLEAHREGQNEIRLSHSSK
jgi:transmembrane sensor